MLCILMRYQNGECLNALSRIYGVSTQTISRWHAKHGHDTQHVHATRLAAMQVKEMDDAHKALQSIKAQVDRALAVLDRVVNKNIARNPAVVMEEDAKAATPMRRQSPEFRARQRARVAARLPKEEPAALRRDNSGPKD